MSDNKKKKESPKKKANKRKNTRIDLYQATYYKMPHSSSDSEISDCWLNNISLGGLSFDTNSKNISPGDQIMVLYRLETNIRKDLVVIRNVRQVFSNWRYGCEFKSKDDSRTESIGTFIDKYMKNNTGSN